MKPNRKERGSLALEQILFIGAIVAMSSGVYAFYGKLNAYFQSLEIPSVQSSPSAN